MHHQDLTGLLDAVHEGDARAKHTLFEVTYSELRRLATSTMEGERPGHTLHPTALVNEAVIKILAGDSLMRTRNRATFFALAARAMRSVLVDHARRRAAAKRPTGNRRRIEPLDESLRQFEEREQIDMLILDEALQQLQTLSQRQHDAVMLRFFGGLRFQEIATHLGVSVSTVEKDWNFARAWLRKTLDEG